MSATAKTDFLPKDRREKMEIPELTATKVPEATRAKPETKAKQVCRVKQVVCVGRKGVAEYLVVATISYCVHDEVRRFEVHVGYPHGQQIIGAEHLVQHVVFHAAGAAAGDYLVKIVCDHYRNVLNSRKNRTFSRVIVYQKCFIEKGRGLFAEPAAIVL